MINHVESMKVEEYNDMYIDGKKSKVLKRPLAKLASNAMGS